VHGSSRQKVCHCLVERAERDLHPVVNDAVIQPLSHILNVANQVAHPLARRTRLLGLKSSLSAGSAATTL